MWAPLLAALTLVPTHTWIRQGPVLAGAHVVWTSDAPAVYVSAPVRRLWRGRNGEIGALAASTSTIAFARTVEHDGVPIRSELWAGRPSGPFRRVTVTSGRAAALDVDVDRRTVAYAEMENGRSRVVVAHATVTTSQDVDYSRVAVAGHYVAWIERSSLEHWPAPPSAVVVYDVAARRVAYTLGSQVLGHTVVSSLDLQADGTVALASDPSPAGGCDGGVAWASVAQPTVHFLSGDAIPWRVRIAAGRIAYLSRTCVAPTPFRLVVKTLADRTLADGVVAYGGFDFDGHRLAHLRSPKVIAVDRLR
jgi:hypothetical protein